MKKTKDIVVIDSINGDLQISLSGQHNPNGIRICLACLGEKLESIHLGHTVVCQNHGKRSLFFDGDQPIGSTITGNQIELIVQDSPVP